MTLNSRMFVFFTLGIGLIFAPARGVRAQDAAAAPASGQQQAQPAAAQDPSQERDPLKRKR